MTPSVESVVVFGATCELSDGAPDLPAFDCDLPVLMPRVLIPPTPTKPETLDPNTAVRPPRRWLDRRLVHTTVDQAPGYQRRSMAYRQRRRMGVSLSYTEFADLSDGTRVIIRNDRGTSWSWRHSPNPWHGMTRQSLADDVRDYFAQVEEDRPCSPEWVVELVALLYEIEVDPASVQAALQMPRQVEFGPRLLQQLQH